jgi:hypothetical protein
VEPQGKNERKGNVTSLKNEIKNNPLGKCVDILVDVNV